MPPELNSLPHWKAVIKGHAAANLVPAVAANRVGEESYKHYNGGETTIKFYGNTFIADHLGEEVACCAGGRSGDRSGMVCHTFDLREIETQRRAWGLFRDRRPDLYGPLMKL